MSLRNFFPHENEAIKLDLAKFKVQCLNILVTMAANLQVCICYGFLITKADFCFQILALNVHFSASLNFCQNTQILLFFDSF